MLEPIYDSLLVPKIKIIKEETKQEQETKSESPMKSKREVRIQLESEFKAHAMGRFGLIESPVEVDSDSGDEDTDPNTGNQMETFKERIKRGLKQQVLNRQKKQSNQQRFQIVNLLKEQAKEI